MKRRVSRRRIRPEEMNITAFMNLMVILVPFLLITAVFTRLTVLDLNLPPSAGANTDAKQELQLEVIVRSDALEIGERSRGVLDAGATSCCLLLQSLAGSMATLLGEQKTGL